MIRTHSDALLASTTMQTFIQRRLLAILPFDHRDATFRFRMCKFGLLVVSWSRRIQNNNDCFIYTLLLQCRCIAKHRTSIVSKSQMVYWKCILLFWKCQPNIDWWVLILQNYLMSILCYVYTILVYTHREPRLKVNHLVKTSYTN